MKRTLLLNIIGLTLLGVVSSSPAVPVGQSNWSREYMISGRSMQRLSGGIFGEGRERDVDVDGIPRVMERSRIMGYVGVDLFSWISLFVMGGTSEVQFGTLTEANDGEFDYGIGVHMNIMDYLILDPTLMEDRLRINATISYSRSKTEWVVTNREYEWNEIFASLIFSIVNDVEGDKRFLPYSIAVFAGPIFSDLIGDIDVDNKTGFTAGLDIFYTESLSISGGIESFGDGNGFVAGLHSRF